MKNTVYFVARTQRLTTIEEFAMELGDYFLDNNAQVSKVSIVSRGNGVGADDRGRRA